ncbi:MAG: HAD family hydrolase [Candidatus Kerfeldbacteria bacterium]
MLKGLLFDLDGTLYKTENMHQSVVRRVFEEHFNETVDADEMKAFVGLTYYDRLLHLFAARGIDDDVLIEELTQKASEITRAELDFTKTVVPGAEALLKAAKDGGLRLAVVSSTTHANIVDRLTSTNMLHYFDLLVGRDDVKIKKPHPEPYEYAMQQLGLQASEVVAFEDSAVGIESARLAGIPVVAMLTTYEREDLAGAAKEIHDFEGLTLDAIRSIAG